MIKSVFIAAGLLLASSTALAQGDAETVKGPLAESAGWKFVTASQEMAVYMKPSARPAKGPLRQVWTAYDSEQPRDRMGFSFRSVASLGEYDCAKRVSRVLRETFHSHQGLTGQTWVQPNFVPTDWAPAAKGTVGEQRMEFACSVVRA